MQEASSAFAGVAFHCYAGDETEQDTFHSQFPSKEIYLTECSGTIGSDWWSDIKWYMDHLFIGAITHNAQSGLMWNLALDGSGHPILSSSNSCGGGCRGIVQINTDGSWSVNQEWLSMAQATKAVLPKDSGGPWGQRIGVSVQGSMSWGLVVGAYVTGRVNPSDWDRYSLVVLNW
jgi:O-glycosyl hydrolase